jgi:hypothetical protein
LAGFKRLLMLGIAGQTSAVVCPLDPAHTVNQYIPIIDNFGYILAGDALVTSRSIAA